MALEAVVFQQDLFGHTSKELYNLLGDNWSYDVGFSLEKEEQEYTYGHFLDRQTENHFLHGNWRTDSSPPFDELQNQINPSLDANHLHQLDAPLPTTTTTTTRTRRRRARTRKNKEEIENQRMTHITVERNRRKQMNEYLSVLRSLMPESYVQRGDQASIIGGAINFVKELEQSLQFLSGRKEIKEKADGEASSLPFSEFFTFPQYSTSSSSLCQNHTAESHETQLIIADVEVNMTDSHANLKIRSRRRPKLLLKVVSGLHSMRLTILHLNVTTVNQIVLYTLSVKVEDDCKLTSVDEIATAVYQLLGRIQEESLLN